MPLRYDKVLDGYDRSHMINAQITVMAGILWHLRRYFLLMFLNLST